MTNNCEFYVNRIAIAERKLAIVQLNFENITVAS